MKVAFLGTGAMGGAILRGLLTRDQKVEFVATVRSVAGAQKLADLAERIEILSGEHNGEANREAAQGADVIFLGVKPAQIRDLLHEISDVLSERAVIVSLAAGVAIASMEAALDLPQSSVIRAMPNTPALIGQGMTGLAAGATVSSEQLAQVEAMFEAVGKVLILDESQIDALSAISGSGPAYVFLFIEEFTRVAQEIGFESDAARMLVQQTFLGAVNLLEHTGSDPAALRAQVTSPKGTTERAVAVLQQAELSGLFQQAAEAAIARAKELAAGS